MNNIIQMGSNSPKVSKKNRWFAGYIIAGIIWYLARGFYKTPIDGIIILIIAILCGYFYHRLKSKVKIKNNGVRIIVTFLILEVVAAFLIGFLTTLI